MARRKKGLGGTEEEMKEKEEKKRGAPLIFQSNLSIWLVLTEFSLFMDSFKTCRGSQFTVGGLGEIFKSLNLTSKSFKKIR